MQAIGEYRRYNEASDQKSVILDERWRQPMLRDTYYNEIQMANNPQTLTAMTGCKESWVRLRWEGARDTQRFCQQIHPSAVSTLARGD
jgi:hypothetical protein